MRLISKMALLSAVTLLASCTTVKYNTLERVGIHKRSDEIDDVEQVAEDLFEEWAEENTAYTDASLRRSSEGQLRDTRARYNEMLKSMKDSEASMQPVLASLYDNVLYLKHNLNAQAGMSRQMSRPICRIV